MELYIWYSTITRSCNIELKDQHVEMLKKDQSDTSFFISKLAVKTKKDYQKAMRLMIKLTRTYNQLNQYSFDRY